MKKIVLGIALVCGLCFPQTITSKLSGKRIFLHRKDGTDHTDGFVGLQKMLDAKKSIYGYTFESSTGSPGEAELNALYNRLYKGAGAHDAGTIDILILCQGQGDQNVGGGASVNPFANAADRFQKVNTHVRSGGGLIMVHAAAGREVSWQNWFFGAKLMTDWFVDNYFASSLNSGNGGHFPYGTIGTYTLDEETLAAKDSSTFFIRNLLTQAKTRNGYGQPLVSPDVKGEWYHFNGGKKFEDGTGGAATHSNNRIAPSAVRGDPGVPDSGIGPAKVVGILTKIGTYVPPGKGRHGVWAREVSAGVFNAKASDKNGRFLYFNPGHAGEEYTDANGWMGDFFFSSLRWVAKDDRGCTNPVSSNYSSLATVNDGGCLTTGIGRDAILNDEGADRFGRISVGSSAIDVSIDRDGPHSLAVVKVNGEMVFRRQGEGIGKYQAAGLKSGFYLVQVNVKGRTFKKLVSIL
ncbi:MAG: hypothetical protein JWO30_2156 [Fibrobacteres bacterium]|nr:hypothetical protein [Fibrobacterota bacterium]